MDCYGDSSEVPLSNGWWLLATNSAVNRDKVIAWREVNPGMEGNAKGGKKTESEL